jgi:hypothetical protein
MKINTRCKVSSSALVNANRIGYFQFYGAGECKDLAILSDETTTVSNKSGNYFTVGRDEIKEL